MASPNDPNAFPEFRINQIERYAKRWINTYPVIQIEQIALYRYLRPADSFIGTGVIKYALDFEISGCTNIDLRDEALSSFPMEGDDECTTALKKIGLANELNHHPLFDLAFVDTVYKEKPDIDYYRNWIFILRRPVDQLWRDLLKDEPHWILFGSEGEDDREKADESTEAGNPLTQTLQLVNFFTQENKRIWHIGFEGQEARIEHCDGLLYISYLLEKPGTSISCRELYQAASGKTPDKIMTEGAAIEEGLNIGGRKQAINSPKTKDEYFRKYQELEGDLLKINDLPDNERTSEDELMVKQTEKEMALLKPYLKERTFSDKDKKRFQVNIQKRLKIAYKAIDKATMKKMAKYLRNNIKPDGAFGLRYTGDRTWHITFK